MTIKEMVTYSGLTQKAFAERYKIKLRTLEDWLAGIEPKGDHVFHTLEKCVKEDFEEGKAMSYVTPEEMTERQRIFYEKGQSDLSNFVYEKNGKKHINAGNIMPILIGTFENGIEVIGFTDKKGRCAAIEFHGRGTYNKIISECDK